MKNARLVILTLLLGVGFTWGILRILGTQYATGNFYPDYSSLRSDPRGAKLLYDTLARTPGVAVDRNYLPLEFVAAQSAAVLLLGLRIGSLDRDLLQRGEGLARGGDRVVMALAFQGEEQPQGHTAIEDAWHVKLAIDRKKGNTHPLSFARADGWEIRERDGSQILAIARSFGKGEILLLAESEAFNNESAVAGEHWDEVAAALGNNARVVFDETHFDIAESGSVVGLMRRFRLTGLALGLIIVVALAIWKNTAAFPPPVERAEPRGHTGRTSFEGLVALVERHVPAKDLVRTCWEEWLKANRREASAESAARAAAIASTAASPEAGVREIQAALRAKGEL